MSGTIPSTAAGFVAELTALSATAPSDNGRFFQGNDPDTIIIGVRMGEIFKLAEACSIMPLSEVEKLLGHRAYEVRMGAVSILDFQARDKKCTPERRKALYELYLRRHDRINNWDLVDRAAPHVVGGYLADKDRSPLYKLAASADVWARRTAIVSTWFFIRKGEVEDTFRIAELLIDDPEETIHKAVGSWIREAGKRAPEFLLAFLDRHAATMPRITLRYAVEKLNSQQKAHYMGRREA